MSQVKFIYILYHTLYCYFCCAFVSFANILVLSQWTNKKESTKTNREWKKKKKNARWAAITLWKMYVRTRKMSISKYIKYCVNTTDCKYNMSEEKKTHNTEQNWFFLCTDFFFIFGNVFVSKHSMANKWKTALNFERAKAKNEEKNGRKICEKYSLIASCLCIAVEDEFVEYKRKSLEKTMC